MKKKLEIEKDELQIALEEAESSLEVRWNVLASCVCLVIPALLCHPCIYLAT